MKTVLKSLAFAVLSSLATTGFAQSGHNAAMDHASHDSMQTQPKMFLEKSDIDGHSVSFHVMAVDPGTQHGGSHNLMIKVEKSGGILSDIVANSKVVFPDGRESSKMLMKRGDWYMAGYDLDPPGEYQLMVLFKTSDGQKHFGGVHYMAE